MNTEFDKENPTFNPETQGNEKTETPFDVVDRTEVRQIYEAVKAKGVRRRDVLEYSLYATFVNALKRYADELTSQPKSENFTADLKTKFLTEIEGLDLTHAQRRSLVTVVDEVSASINEFDQWLDGKSDQDVRLAVTSYFEEKHPGIGGIEPEKIAEVDTKKYPGAIMVKLSEDAYINSALLGTNLGWYSSEGPQPLAGRILLLSHQAPDGAGDHEYRHFLQATALPAIDDVAGTRRRVFRPYRPLSTQSKTEPAESSDLPSKESGEEKIKKLETEIDGLRSELNQEDVWTRSGVVQSIRGEIKSKGLELAKAREKQDKGLLALIWRTTQVEAMAHASHGWEILRPTKIIAGELYSQIFDKKRGANFLRGMEKLRNLSNRLGKTESKNDLAYLIASASTLGQAIKFLIIHEAKLGLESSAPQPTSNRLVANLPA